MIRTGLIKARGAYNLFDRIVDNLTVEVASVTVRFQPWGRFKTRRPGPWTPPELELALAGIHLVSVNEFGQEAPPDEVWRHNHNRSASGSLLIYKKLSMEYKISIKPAGAKESIPLVTGRDNKVEVHLAMKRRIRDGEWLAVQVDMTIPRVEVNIPQEVIPHLVHTLAGVSYCVAKDRAFEDPLKSVSHSEQEETDGSPRQKTNMPSLVDNISEDDDEIEDDLAIDQAPVQVEDEVSSDEESNPVDGVAKPAAVADTPAAPKVASGRYALPDNVQNQPVILLPNGLTISEKLSVSISVYDFTLRGGYADGGYVEVVSKGCIGEAIWPKTSREKGGYVQASVSYVTVEEKYGDKLRTLMSGGVKYDSSLPVELPGKPLSEFGSDDTFPLYENRVIRPDPLSLRHTFPAQAFGLKSTIEFVEKLSQGASVEEVQVLHETGVDKFDIVLDAGPWMRILRYLSNEGGGGFDPRWYSGNWSKDLTAAMLLKTSVPLNLDYCLQATKQIFLDENEFISSDLFNVTCRMTKVCLRVPAAIKENLTASDIILRLDEGMFVVSSALPRTMLSGRIGTSVNGDNVQNKGIIDFPNDPSDVAYQLESSEDPSNRQRGVMTTKTISTFRLQFTVRGVSLKIIPIVPFYAAKQPQEFLAPTDATMIICFEGEPPESDDSNLTKMVLFTSILAHRVAVNFDIELLASALCTTLAHYGIVAETVRRISSSLAASFVDETETELSGVASEIGEEGKIRRSVLGRRLLVKRQISRSTETGGLSVAVGIQVKEFSFLLWRQCVPESSPLRTSSTEKSYDARYIPLVRLMEFTLEELELGLEASFKQDDRRIVCKGCLSNMIVAACDLSGSKMVAVESSSPSGGEKADEPIESNDNLSEMFSLGRGRTSQRDPLDYAAAFRIEEVLQDSRSWSLSADICESSRLTFRPEELESLASLVFEALMQPSNFNSEQQESESDVDPIFPRGTIGGLVVSLFPEDMIPSDGLLLMPEFAATKAGAIPAKSLDAILRKFLEKIPEDVRTVLIRSRVQDFGLFIPPRPGSSGETSNGFCLVFHSLDFSAHYLSTSSSSPLSSPLFSVIARKGATWAELVQKGQQGLFHQLESTQSLSAATESEDSQDVVMGDVFVPKFAFGYSYADSRAVINIPAGLAVEEVEQLDSFLFSMLAFRERCMTTISNMANILKTLRAPRFASQISVAETQPNPVALACTRTSVSLQSVLGLLDQINVNLMKYDDRVSTILTEKDRTANKARLVAFMREKERLAAYAMTSSQKMGWLRIGVASKSGMRGAFSATLWPYWTVLRKGILICYGSPGSVQPLHMIPMNGASLVELTGGNRKKDLRRAFGLLDSVGALHTLIASSDSDFFGWVHEMNRSMGDPSDSGVEDGASVATEDGLGTRERLRVDSEESEVSQERTQQRLLGRTLSKAVQVAKASKQAVVERRTRRADGEAEPAEIAGRSEVSSSATSRPPSAATAEHVDDASLSSTHYPQQDNDSAAQPSRRQQLTGRFAGVGQMTKSRLGGAMLKARQKGREVAEKGREVADRRRNRQQLASESFETPSVTITEDAISQGSMEPWNCPACTFSNSGNAHSCSMCSAPRPDPDATQQTVAIDGTERVGEVPQTVVASTSANSKEEDTRSLGDSAVEFQDGNPTSVESNQRVGMRQRLGAVVRTARTSGRESTADPNRGSSRFAFRLHNSTKNPDAAGHDSAPSYVALRNIAVAGPLEEQTHPFGEKYLPVVLPQKRLQKNWFVRVKIADLNPTATESPDKVTPERSTQPTTGQEESKQERVAVIEESEGLFSAPALTMDQGRAVADEDEQRDISEADAVGTDILAKIEVYQQSETAQWIDRPASVVNVPLTAVFALHAEISESVASLPPPATYPSIEPRKESGALRHSLATAFGLTALDTVRLAGTLLSGLLQYEPSSGEYSISRVSPYHGTLR